MKKFNPLVKSSIIYSISNIYIRIINLLVLIFTTKYISPSELGLFKTLQIVPSFSKYLCFDFFSLTLRESAKINMTGFGVDSSIRNSSYTYYSLWNIIIILSVSILFLNFFSEYIAFFPFLIFSLIFIIIVNLFKNDLKLMQRFGTISLIESFSYTGSFILFILTVKEYKLYSRLSFDLFIPILAFVFSMFLFKFRFKLNFSKSEILRQMKISLPLYITTLLHGLFLWFERLYIGSTLGLEQLGFYMFIIIIIELLSIIISSFIHVYNVHIYKKLNSYNSFNKCIIDIGDLFFTVSFLSISFGFLVLLFGTYLINSLFVQYKTSVQYLFYVPVILWFSSILNVFASICISEYFNKQKILVLIKIFSFLIYLVFVLLYDDQNLSHFYFSRCGYIIIHFLFIFGVFITFTQSNKLLFIFHHAAYIIPLLLIFPSLILKYVYFKSSIFIFFIFLILSLITICIYTRYRKNYLVYA
mgnify:CR=1 FL=1